MTRKLKTFVTTAGFFELAVAAPSMKAAVGLLGVKDSAFAQGFAHETDDLSIRDVTMERPGTVLRRAVGTKGKFAENAELPKLSALQHALKHKRAAAPQRAASAAKRPKAAKSRKKNTDKDQKAAELYDLAEKRRERDERKAEASRIKEKESRGRATEKARLALEEARSRHRERMGDIEMQREVLDQKARLENERWEKEEAKFKAALRSAKGE